VKKVQRGWPVSASNAVTRSSAVLPNTIVRPAMIACGAKSYVIRIEFGQAGRGVGA